ncbi:uncharacterized protein METZ01_LOCUS511131, partial [marine metagenome]
MIKPSFQQLLYSQSLDTWVVSGVAQVDALVDEVYHQFLGHELKKNSRKTKSTLKIILLNLYSAFVSDPELYLRYSRDENFYSSSNHYVSQFVSYQSLVTKVIPGLVRLSLIQDNPGFIDRESIRGNRAVRDHIDHSREIHLFESSQKSGFVRYLGEFSCAG